MGEVFVSGGRNFFESTASRTVGGWGAEDKGAGGNPRFPPAVLFISFRYRICFRQNKLQYRSNSNHTLKLPSTVFLSQYK